jgi:deoxyadenosine/deoxycytidine kinase
MTIDTSSMATTLKRGVYIAISGNTGAGKSTLVRAICSALPGPASRVVGVNERQFHHAMLPWMFAEPHVFALPIQLNFLVQRGLFLLDHLAHDFRIVMERSHYDDRLFVEDHFERGNIDSAEFNAYMTISRWMEARLRPPDIHVLLDVSPETSFRRVKQSELSGERPVEFPNDDTLRSYITSWHPRYRAYFERLISRPKGTRGSSTIFAFNETTGTDTMVTAVVGAVGRKALHVDGLRAN